MQYDYPSYSGFRCVACNIGFSNFDDQKKHYFAYHSRNVNPAPATFTQFTPKTKKNINKPPAIEIKCDICNLTCSSTVTYDFHVKGKRHTKAISKLTLISKGNQNVNSAELHETDITPSVNGTGIPMVIPTADVCCKDCDVSCATMEQLQVHFNGAKHQKVLKMKKCNEMMAQKDPSVYCSTCDIYLFPELMAVHVVGGKHKRKCKDICSNEPEIKKRKVKAILTTIEECGYCGMFFKSAEEAIFHFQSKFHMMAMTSYRKITEFQCQLCDIYLDTSALLDKHLNGFKHYVRANRGNHNPEGEMSIKLLKMREKMKTIKIKKIAKNKLKRLQKAEMEIPALDNFESPADNICLIEDGLVGQENNGIVTV